MNHFLSVPLVSCLWFLISPTAHAIVDTNNNGLSDLWEKAHNDGNLFPGNFDPLADPDGDGWTNAQEAAAGTDPSDQNPPTGFVRPAITHIPAVYGTDLNGDPELVSPEAVTITWPTIVGKQYNLLFSVDLNAGNWISVGDPFFGYGNDIETTVAPTQAGGGVPDKLFWRVAVDDSDTDGDGLNNYEEYLFGSDFWTDDSDQDGLRDADELKHGTFPREPDSDGDGATDSEEVNHGTDPLSSATSPAVWSSIERKVQYDFDDYPPEYGGVHGSVTYQGSWQPGGGNSSQLTAPIDWTVLHSRLNLEIPFPDAPPQALIRPKRHDNYASLLPNPPCYHANLAHQRFWLRRNTGEATVVRSKILFITQRNIDGGAPAYTRELKQATLQPGETFSTTVADLEPAFTTNPTGNTGASESVSVYSFPLEVATKKKVVTLLDDYSWTVAVPDYIPDSWVTNYQFEMRRESGTAWTVMQTGSANTYTEKARVAGKFEVKAYVAVLGELFVTHAIQIECRFPSGEEILGKDGVRARMDQAWQETLDATTPTSRREQGYYITVDTATGTYGTTAESIGTPVPNGDGANWDTAAQDRPPDSIPNPTPTDRPVYTVAWYHTHTPTLYGVPGTVRRVGPSQSDFNWSADERRNIPGYAQDYTATLAGGQIPAGHPLESPNQVYHISPPERRPTP